MPSAKKYATAGAFQRALEERLKTTSMKEQTDLNRLRRQVSFDRLLARLFRGAAPPWFLKGGYALELRYKAARSTVDIDLTVQSVAVSAGEDQNQIVREMLQSAADVSLGDWFEFTFGAPIMDLTAAPHGGARYPVEARMDERIFARFHLDAGIGDVVSPPVDGVLGPARNSAISAVHAGANDARCRPIGGDAVGTLHQTLQIFVADPHDLADNAASVNAHTHVDGLWRFRPRRNVWITSPQFNPTPSSQGAQAKVGLDPLRLRHRNGSMFTGPVDGAGGCNVVSLRSCP